MRLIAEMIGYGPMPTPDKEIEQRLTLNSRGQIWFSNYLYGDGVKPKLHRKERSTISPTDAAQILRLVSKEFASPQSSGFVTDVGMWRLSLLNEAGQSFKYEGSLVSHGDNDLLGIASAELRKTLSMAPFGGLHGALAARAIDAPAPPVIGGIDDTIRAQSRGDLRQPVAVQGHLVDAPNHGGGLRLDHPKPGIVRVLDVAVGRRGERDTGVALHLVDDPALFGDVLGVVLIHNVFERGEIILALVAVYAIGHSHQPHIMEWEVFLGESTHLDVVSAQPGEVFHEHRRDIPGLDGPEHFLKAGAVHGGAGDAVIHKKDGVRIALFLGGLLENFLLVLDAVGLAVHVIVTA